MEVKSCGAVAFKADAEGTFTARIATFDKPDKAGDVVRRGAFRDTLASLRAHGHTLPVVFSHAFKDPQQFIGECNPDDITETAIGVEARGRLYLDDPNAAKVFSLLRRGVLREWSYAYIVQKAKTIAAGARELLAVDLLELGPCLTGVGDTATLGTKSDEIKAALAAHRRELVADQLDPHRARIDLVRRRLALERAARA